MLNIRDNFFAYAQKYYDNPQCKTIEEFNEDMQRFIYIKKLMNRRDCNPRLILNHIVVLFNVFDRYACAVMLFHKLEEEYWVQIKTYLTYLDLMPEQIPELGIVSSDISLDKRIVENLRQL